MTQTCFKCHRDRELDQFYSTNPLCKVCVLKIRSKRRSFIARKSKQRFLEQASVLNLIKQLQTDNLPFVYLIRANKKYKIGYSTNVESRIRTFNTANSEPCTIVGVAPGGSKLEKQLHKEFSKYRIHGEWFLKTDLKTDVIFDRFQELPGSVIFLPGHLKKYESFRPSCQLDVSEPLMT